MSVELSVELYLDCSACGGPQPFEQPPCADDHGADCPELICVACGSALIMPSVATAAAVEPARQPRAA